MNTETLKHLGLKLTAQKFDESAQAFYDLMSGGLIWTDEQLMASVEEMGYFRALVSYRTGLIINKEDGRFRDLWSNAQTQFPKWIGFNETRCKQNTILAEFYYEEKRRSQQEIDRL